MPKAISRLEQSIAVGQRFGKYEVVETGHRLASGDRLRPASMVRCECGFERIVRDSALLAGKSRSCGAGACSGVIGEGVGTYKHGQRNRPGYSCWNSMIRRCEDPKHKDFLDYGGRGIRVCERWRASPKAFLDDMGPRPAGMSIDRIEVNGHYEPGNCRWADDLTQGRNRRNAIRIVYEGREMFLVEICALTGIPESTARKRIYEGWDPLRAVTAPLRGKRP